MPKGYWIARVDVHTPERYGEYIAAAKPAFERYEANFIARGGVFVELEGPARARNVVIESAEPDGVRGHTMYHRASTGSVSYAEFRHLGKEGVLGKYSLHFHLAGESMRGGSVIGAMEGLYGGTRKKGHCDQDAVVSFLASHPDKARAWAEVQGITTDRIAGFVSRLTPVVVRADVAVTNHGYANGAATVVPSASPTVTESPAWVTDRTTDDSRTSRPSASARAYWA